MSEEEKLPVVYIGPNSSKLGLVRFNHYTELDKMEHIQAAFEAYPALKVLFIPLEEFGTRAPAVYAGRDAVITHAVKRLAKDGVF